MRNRLTECLLLAILCSFFAPAMAAEAQWGVAQLMHELGQVKRSQARFSERKYLKVLKQPLQSSGTLTYVAPDRLEKRTL
ncbi:MAG TPA: outer membrane lipoprotein carrier protein LolA, partial [Burkholderiales bacterium]